MGCGMSRYGIADHLGFQPIKKKLDDLRRNDRLIVTVDDTPSTKLLLRDGEDHVVPNADDSRKSISSPHVESAKGPSLEHKESLKIAKGGSTTKKNGVEEKEKQEVKSKNVKEVVATERGGSKDGKRGGGEGEEESDSDDDEGRVSDYDGSAMWIGSPSFREYCHNDAESEDSFKAGGE